MRPRFTLVILACLALPAWAESPGGHGGGKPSVGGGHWSYEGATGPEQWAGMGFPECRGHNQSPIDIAGGADAPLDPLVFHYQPSAIQVVNNGHTVQFNLDPGSSLTAGGKEYKLLQFHFHSGSEHTVQGKTLPLEVHLVHKSDDGQLAVVGVFFQGGGHESGEGLATIFGALPGANGQQLTGKDRLEPRDLLPATPTYYHYKGSLTTPPCSEGVNWFVMQEPMTLPDAFITRFQTIFAHNNRPPQPLGERALFHQAGGGSGAAAAPRAAAGGGH